MLTEQALKMGLAGLVVNGAVRDAAAITDAGFPVFFRGLPIKGASKSQPGFLARNGALAAASPHLSKPYPG